MANLIKNLPSPAIAAKGNRGIISTTGTKFLLYTDWFNLITNVTDLIITPADYALIKRQPLEDSAAMTEESTGTFQKFYAIPSNVGSNPGSIGLDIDGPLEITSSMSNSFGDTFVSLTVADVLNPSNLDKPWSKVLISDTGTTMIAMTVNGEVFVSTDSGGNWFLRKPSSSGVWKKIVMSADGVYQTAIAQGGLIYVSVNSGTTWTGKQSNNQWFDVAMSSDGKVQTAVVAGGQIFVSTDYGNTWTGRGVNATWSSVHTSSGGEIQTAFFTPSVSQTRKDLYISTDFGATWNFTSINLNLDVSSFKMSANGLLQAIVTSVNTVYISQNAGSTWVAKEFGDGKDGVLAMSPDGTKLTIAANKFNGSSPTGLSCAFYVSVDSGNTWLQKNVNGLDPTAKIREVLMSSDGTKQVAAEIASNSRICVSTDSGNNWYIKERKQNWSSITMSSSGSKILAAVNPGRIYMYSS